MTTRPHQSSSRAFEEKTQPFRLNNNSIFSKPHSMTQFFENDTLFMPKRQTETFPNTSVEALVVQGLLNEPAHPTIVRHEFHVLVQTINSRSDLCHHPCSCSRNAKSPIPPLQDGKDILDWVEVRGVCRKVDLSDVVLLQILPGFTRVMDSRIVHGKARSSSLQLWKLLDKLLDKSNEFLRSESAIPQNKV